MTIELREALAIAPNMGDQFVSTETVLTFPSVVISYSAPLPRTWDYLGTMYREVLINDEWTIISSHVITPGRPNLFTWEDTAPYRLSFRLVKYIYAGNLLIYSHNAEPPLDLAQVAFTGDYNDLLNKPVISGPSNEFAQLDRPTNPSNGDIWIQTDYQRPIRNSWTWYNDKQAWLGPLLYGSARVLLTGSSNLVGPDIPYYETGRILIESIVYSCWAYDSTWELTPGVETFRYNDPAIVTFTATPETPRTVGPGFAESRHYQDYLSANDRVVLKAGHKPTRLSGTGNLSLLISVGYRLMI